MRKLVLIVASLVAALVLVIAVLPRVVGLNSFKPQIADAVREATGRELQIGGDIGLAILPGLALRLSDLSLSNPTWATAPSMMTLANAELDVSLLPLLGGKLVIDRLVLRDLALYLEQDAEGQASWELAGGPQGASETGGEAPPQDGGGLPFSDIQLGELRVENGSLSYLNHATGQEVTAAPIDLAAALPGLDSALTLDGGLTLNGEPVTLGLSVETPGQAMRQEPFAVAAELGSALIEAGYTGRVQQQPVPGLDGRFELDIASVGRLAAWLDQPLAEGQPDPGPLKVSAVFTADGQTAVLQQATIEGEALQATATGRLDSSGDITKLQLTVDSGLLDIDRYLPPPAPGAVESAVQERPAGAAAEGSSGPRDLLAGLSDEPIDLTALRHTEADIAVTLAGVKAAGYEVGRLAFTSSLKDSVLIADLEELALYGGRVTGRLGLDAAGEALGADVALDIDKVDVGALARVASPEEPPVGGVASGKLQATAEGASPRALAASLQGQLDLDLGGLDLKTAQAAALTGLQLKLELPGLQASPSLHADLVYNRERVTLDAGLAPLDQVLSGAPFAARFALASALVKAGYEGTVQQQPLPGLDGRFSLDVPSVGKLAAWAGQPLAAGQPDPGPLKVDATFTADGQTVTLQQATIAGDGLQARATGSFDGSGAVKKIALDLESGLLDIDRYLPPPAPDAASQAETSAGSAPVPSADLLAGLPDEPFDLTPLRGTEADIKVALGGLKAAGFEIGRVALTAALRGGVLDADLTELALYGGAVTGQLKLDGAGDALGTEVALTVDKVDVGALARAATAGEPPLGGVASGSLQASGRGTSPRALAEDLKGRLAVDLGGLDLQNGQAAALTALKLQADLPGMAAAPSVTADLVYNQEPVNVQLGLAPLRDMLGGAAFALSAKIASAPITASYDGKVQQQPMPGLDGRFDLEVGSVGKLAAWLGQPLPAEQPDPGPLKVAAVFAADGAKIGLKEASIEGKALKAKAEGSFDGSGAVAFFKARLTVDELNADAYLPPPTDPETGGAPSGQPAPESASQGWSEEPFDLEPLRQAQGDVAITTGPVTYRGLVIEKSNAVATLRDGLLRFELTDMTLANGTIAAKATLDGSGPAAALTYEAAVEGVQAKPLLSALSGIDWLSGTTIFNAKGSASGRNQKELVGDLNGDGAFKFLDGAIEGVNLAKVLRQAGTLGLGDAGEAPKTDFSELSGSFVITNGVLDNQDLKMLAPLVRLGGAGQVPLPSQSIDYLAEAKLVASLEGQGGEEALAGLPIPIRVKGPWSGLSYDIDWQSVFQQAAADPKRLMQMPDNLKEAAKGFGVNLPLPGGEGLGKVLKTLPGLPSQEQEGQQGGGATQGAVEGLQKLLKPQDKSGAAGDGAAVPQDKATSPLEGLKGLLKQGETPAAEPEAAPQPEATVSEPDAAKPSEPATVEPAPQQAPQKEPEGLQLEKPLDALKGLFNN